jgi:putative ABC transport system permease protein
MGALLMDARIALRSLLRAPSFMIAAVLTLALGIGANTAIFSAVHGVLLRPLPFPDAERLVAVWLTSEQDGIDRDVGSYPIFREFEAGTGSLSQMAASARTSGTFAEGEYAEQVPGLLVTGGYFGLLGVPPAYGRVLTTGDTVPGLHQVVVLSHGLWTRQFGADPAVIGRAARIDGIAYEVVGVMPAGFGHPPSTDFWRPLARTEQVAGLLDNQGALWLSMIGRLAPGVRFARADAEAAGVLARFVEEEPEALGAGTGVLVEPLRDAIVGDVRPALLVLLGAVGFVLLIACANVANLLLARGTVRQKELAVRSALGASGGRLARQVLTESLVLAAIGGAAGLLLAYWGTAALIAASPPDLPRIEHVHVDGVVIAFATLLALLTGALFGIAPALHARLSALGSVLREGGRGGTGDRISRVRPVLIAAEVALALMLLVGAGLLIRSFASLQAVDPGFRTERVLSFRLALTPSRYPEQDQVRAFRSDLIERLEAMPQVQSVRGINTLLLDALPNMAPIAVEGREPATTGAQAASVTQDLVDPGFFASMGVPIVRGRDFGPQDVQGGVPAAVVNETFARRYFPGESPIDRRFTWGNPTNPEAIWYTIVGVAADTRRSGLAAPVRAEAFRSATQIVSRSMEYLVRTTGEPLALVPQLRELVREMDAELPLARVRTVEQAFADALATRRFIVMLLAVFAAVAVVLAAVGIYGVLSFLVGQRTRELGIRMALGAERRDVLALVLRDSLRNVLPGVLIGLAGSLALTRLLRAQLVGITPTDPLTFAGVTMLLLGVALCASWIPARRAARIEPMVTLRQE